MQNEGVHNSSSWVPAGVWGYTPLQAAVLVTCCTLAPTLLIRNFKSISSLSMLGFSSRCGLCMHVNWRHGLHEPSLGQLSTVVQCEPW